MTIPSFGTEFSTGGKSGWFTEGLRPHFYR